MTYWGPGGRPLNEAQDDRAMKAEVEGRRAQRPFNKYSVDYGPKTTAGTYIADVLMPEWFRQFIKANNEYGEYEIDAYSKLGEIIELRRKLRKLERAFIDRVDYGNWRETPREVLLDMIGHSFLLLNVLDEEGHRPFSSKPWPEGPDEPDEEPCE